MRRRLAAAGLALALAAAMTAQHGCGGKERPPAPGEKPLSLIVVVVDTLRSDMLCGRAGEPAEMPATHALARRGVLFPNAVAPAPWTVPSVTSLLTGLLPREHGVHTMEPALRLPGPVSTWAEVLARRGYQTAVYTGSPFGWIGPDRVFKGFTGAAKGAVRLQRAVLDLESWWRSLDRSKPFFLLLHWYEAHDPYGERNYRLPGEPSAAPFDPEFRADRVTEAWERTRYFMLDRATREAFVQSLGERPYYDAVVRYLWSGYRAQPRPALAAELRAAYVEGVRWVDGLLGGVWAWLDKERVLDGAALAVTADHGEAFGEHGTLEHGRVCYDEVVRVPLLLVGPGALGPGPDGRGRVVTANVSLMDLMPTLLEAAGQPLPPGVVGTSLVPVIEGREGGRIAEVQERLNHDVTREDLDWALRALRSDAWKAVFTWDRRAGTVREEAYDLAADPAEQHDLARGTGRLDGLAFDPAFCREVERVRDELAREGARGPRPAPCGPK